MELNVFFFPPSLDTWKEEGKAVSLFFFLNLGFHCSVAKEGAGGVGLINLTGGDPLMTPPCY